MEAPVEGRVLLRPWPFPAGAQLCLPFLGEVFPRFPQHYTCRTCTPVINLKSSSLLYFFSHSSPDHCLNWSSRYQSRYNYRDWYLTTSECLDNKIHFVLNLCVLLAPGSSTLYLPAIHLVCSSACLAAWNSSLPAHLLLFPNVLVRITKNLRLGSSRLITITYS